MLEFEGKIKKWGNFAGLRLSKDDLKKNKLKFNQKVRVMIIPSNAVKVKDLIGTLKIKKSTRKIMKEIDRDLDIEF